MPPAGSHRTQSPWYGPTGGIPEILLFWALLSTHATGTTNEATQSAHVVGVGCAVLAVVFLVLSWGRSSLAERAFSVLLGAASVWVFVVVGYQG
jgi:hypothetical protein